MMKKILSILLVVGLLFVAADSFAQMNRFNVSQKILLVTSVNNAGTHATTDISTAAVLVPGAHRILGYTVSAIAAGGTEIYGTLYDSDATTDNLTTAKLVAEAESRSAGDTVQVWFPYPREITTGIIVQQGAYTCVTVYYEYYNGA
jgi:hypothetical protein